METTEDETVWVLEYVADHAAGDVLGVFREAQAAKDSITEPEQWTWDTRWGNWKNADGSLEIRKFPLQ